MSQKVEMKGEKSPRTTASRFVECLDVQTVLQHWYSGHKKPYDSLLEMLGEKNLRQDDLIQVLRSTKSCVAQLDRSHEVLVGTLMKVNWPCAEGTVIKEYQSFLLNLLSAHTYYLRAGLRMLVLHLIPNLNEVDSDGMLKDQKKFVNVHLLLRAVSSIIPMTWTLLLPLLTSCFPFILKPLYCIECYTMNLLHVPSYMCEAREPILELIISKLLQLDVRCPRVDIEMAEGESDDEEKMEDVLFELEDVVQHGKKLPSMKLEDAHKLDVLMETVLNYIQNVSYKNGTLDWESCKKLYRELLLVFERIVLPTHASCHTQFFMLYLCSFRPALAEGFLDYLWKKFQDPNTQAVFRQTCIAYIGSFLSRASYISASTVKTCLELIMGWIHGYMETLSAESVYADIARHSPFYAACQAVFYVFCFRSSDILSGRKSYKWAESLQLQKVITSRLNPLKACLPIVVKTFSSLARNHQLAFCDTVIEKNKRCVLPVAAQDQDGYFQQKTTLDSFFPFDPYLLVRSGKLIQPLYREYEGGMEEDSDVERHVEDDDFLTEPGTSMTEASSIPDPRKPVMPNFLQYSTSPGFKHV